MREAVPARARRIGKMSQTSQPYKPGDAVNWRAYSYDGLGRTTPVVAADGQSATTYSYFGSTTVVTDPAGKWKSLTTDIDGNLVSVIEPDPKNPGALPTSALNCAAAPTGYLGTCYTYDMLKNLTRVDLYRDGHDQFRTFTYKPGTNWLMSATNPENGTVTYTRDSVGKVLTRVDAKNQTTTYSYDTYNRLTQVTRKPAWAPLDPCQTENYTYDQSIDGTFPGNSSWGKLTSVTFGNGTSGYYNSCPGTAIDGSSWGSIVYKYQYSPTGQITGKRMSISRTGFYGGGEVDLDAYWTYDSEGKVTQVRYPVVTNPDTQDATGTVHNVTYDLLGRPSTMVTDASMPDQPNMTLANGVVYNAAGQMTQISYGGYSAGGTLGPVSETRVYNAMNQLTQLWAGQSGSWFSENYNYSSSANNGQVSSVTEGTGETVAYAYDQLKRLMSATSSVGGQQMWQQTYTYDGFGNMTDKSGGFNMLVDPATNRLTGLPAGWSYDANGNLSQGGWLYDVENRMVGVDNSGGERYMYDPSNKRVYKQNRSGLTYFFYGVNGKVMGEYTASPGAGGMLAMTRVTESGYFAGKKVLPAVMRDRLGSVRAGGSGANRPYGENYLVSNGDGFGTYY